MDRITYIYLYSNDEVRYIMNRSIAFENVIGKKMMDALMCLGLNTYAKLLYNRGFNYEKAFLFFYYINIFINSFHISY